MHIQPFPSGPFETNAYVATSPETKECIIIDPAPDSYTAIAHYIDSNALIPKMIVLTHSHWDHIADVDPLKKKYKVPVLIHALDVPNLENPGADGLPCWLSIPSVHPDRLMQDGEVISFGNLAFEVIHTPGHTPGGVSLYFKEPRVLFSGDTLFQGTIGNLSFPTSQPKQMWNSLDRLAKLPPETKVYPGHGPTTTIGKESWLPRAREMFDS